MIRNLLFAAALSLSFVAAPVRAEEHPRIDRAIHEMEDAIAYMEAAPHDFGGHKAEAIRATRAAIEQLRMAKEYRVEHRR